MAGIIICVLRGVGPLYTKFVYSSYFAYRLGVRMAAERDIVFTQPLPDQVPQSLEEDAVI